MILSVSSYFTDLFLNDLNSTVELVTWEYLILRVKLQYKSNKFPIFIIKIYAEIRGILHILNFQK
jgi:hypothetical protein